MEGEGERVEVDTRNEERMILIGRIRGWEDARRRGKGSSLGRRTNGGSRARGVEADAHRVPRCKCRLCPPLICVRAIRETERERERERTLDLAFPKERIEKRPRKPPRARLIKFARIYL